MCLRVALKGLSASAPSQSASRKKKKEGLFNELQDQGGVGRGRFALIRYLLHVAQFPANKTTPSDRNRNAADGGGVTGVGLRMLETERAVGSEAVNKRKVIRPGAGHAPGVGLVGIFRHNRKAVAVKAREGSQDSFEGAAHRYPGVTRSERQA